MTPYYQLTSQLDNNKLDISWYQSNSGYSHTPVSRGGTVCLFLGRK